MPSEAELAEANRLAEARAAKQHAKRIAYDRVAKTLMITLRSGVIVAVPIAKIPWLSRVKPDLLATLQLYPTGEAIALRKLDIDVSVPGLLREILGFELQQHRAARVKTPARAAAARANGAKGGRPRKREIAS